MEDPDRQFERAYAELCRIARAYRGRRASEVPDGAALVHEAYLRSKRRAAGDPAAAPADFVHATALAMRTLARDRRRQATARKRGGGRLVSLADADPGEAGAALAAPELLALREALELLAGHDRRWYQALVHHDLAGYDLGETAELLNVSVSEVRTLRRAALRWVRATVGRAPPRRA